MVSRDAFVVPGFRAAAVACGMRYRNRPDLALIAADSPAAAAGVFTTNRFTAAPVDVCRKHLHEPYVRGILINAGIANACTGDEGLRLAAQMAAEGARALGVQAEEMLVASTGVIGQQLRMEPLLQALPELCQSLRADGWQDVARAIMTTDTVPKMASVKVDLCGKIVTIGGVAKGSGMIAPNMATMLAFVCTDAAVQPSVLHHWLLAGCRTSFNCITIDGDTSTNDCVLTMASGHAQNELLDTLESEPSRQFGAALQAVLLDLAKQIVYDGEGATKFIAIRVTGATDEAGAQAVATTIANSPLVKTAFFGEDANWGRVVAAAGRSGVPLVPERTTLFFDDICVFKSGMPLLDPETEKRASQVFKQKEIHLNLDLGMGDAEFIAYTCDLSYDYVKINASYRS